MKLLTKELIKKLPPLRSQSEKESKDIPIIIKFFHPFSEWTWYVAEGEQTESGDWEFFGLVRGDFVELGSFMLSDLESLKVRGLGIERDMYFGNHTIAEAEEKRL